MTREEFKAKVSMAFGSMKRETWEEFLEAVWQLHLQASNQWIPVEEELPPASCGVISDSVLVFIGNNIGWCGYIREGFYNHAAKEWSYMNRGRTHKVTHWMPLPQAPRKEDKE
jgi:hypothetical protein